METKKMQVPIRKTASLGEFPAEVKAGITRKFDQSFLAFDIDQTLVQTDRVDPRIMTTLSNRPVLQEIAWLLESDIPVVIISGNDMKTQEDRVIPPLKSFLQRQGNLHLLRKFHFFANTGASRYQFKQDGEKDMILFEAHINKYCINPNDWEVIRGILQENFKNFTLRATEDERIEVREYSGKILQITLKPFTEQKQREAAINLILEKFRENNISRKKYSVLAAGKTSVDIALAGISKAKAIEIIMDEMNISREKPDARLLSNPVYYFGDEFSLTSDDLGNPVYGNDIPVLRVSNVIAFAVNEDQAKVPHHPHLIKAGSGPAATLTLLRYFRKNLQLDGDKQQPPPAVPLIKRRTVEIPGMIAHLDFQKTALVLRINSLLVDPMQKEYFEDYSKIKLQNSILAPVARLLKRDVKILFLSGDSREKQVAVVGILFDMLKKDEQEEKIEHVTLYANGGATKSTFAKNKAGNLKIETHEGENQYSRARKIDRGKFGDIPRKVIEEYRKLLKEQVGDKKNEADMYVKEINSDPEGRLIDYRDKHYQIAINYIMPSLRRDLLLKAKELTCQKEELENVLVREGGFRTIEFNHEKATKMEALEDYRKKTGIGQFIYFGTQFYHKLDRNGIICSGSDMEVLECDPLIALAFNHNQDEIKALGNPKRIIAGGSGANAAFIWLNFFADNLTFRI